MIKDKDLQILDLSLLGWDDFFQAHYNSLNAQNSHVGRIVLQHKKSYTILSEYGEQQATVSGKYLHAISSSADLPVVGDWIVFRGEHNSEIVVIDTILPRRTKISRDTGTRLGYSRYTDEQVLVANVDLIFLMTALNEELNVRRLERYLTMIWDSGAKPVILLNKADLIADQERVLEEISETIIGVPIHLLSAKMGTNLNDLSTYLERGVSIALFGSSGVGKSTLINKLVGEDLLKVADVTKYKDKGRHTTSHRELIMLSNGAVLIDNPGIRAIQIWDGELGLLKSFNDIEELSQSCRFNDCKHDKEPGCAVKQAITDGHLLKERYENYLKLQREMEYKSQRLKQGNHYNAKKRWKQVKKAYKASIKTENYYKA